MTNHLPWPAEWTRPRRGPWFLAVVLFVLLGLVSVLLGFREPGLQLVGGLLMLAVALLIYAQRCRPRGGREVSVREIDDLGHAGVVLPYSGAVTAANLVMLGYLAVVGWVVVLGGLLTGGLAGSDVLVLAVFALVGLVGTVIVVEVLLGRLTRGFVALTPSGVYHRSWGVRGFLPWPAVLGVRPVQYGEPVLEFLATANAPGAWHRRTALMARSREKGLPALRGHTLAADPALAYHAVSFYLENPDLRPELASEAAVTRLREGRLA